MLKVYNFFYRLSLILCIISFLKKVLYKKKIINFFIAALYLLYAKLEEEHGLARHAMSVYERATNAVLPEEKFDVLSLYMLIVYA